MRMKEKLKNQQVSLRMLNRQILSIRDQARKVYKLGVDEVCWHDDKRHVTLVRFSPFGKHNMHRASLPFAEHIAISTAANEYVLNARKKGRQRGAQCNTEWSLVMHDLSLISVQSTLFHCQPT